MIFDKLLRPFNQGRTCSWMRIPGKTWYPPSKPSCTLSKLEDYKSCFSTDHLELREVGMKEREIAWWGSTFWVFTGEVGVSVKAVYPFCKSSSSGSRGLWWRHHLKSTWKTELNTTPLLWWQPGEGPKRLYYSSIKGTLPQSQQRQGRNDDYKITKSLTQFSMQTKTKKLPPRLGSDRGKDKGRSKEDVQCGLLFFS